MGNKKVYERSVGIEISPLNSKQATKVLEIFAATFPLIKKAVGEHDKPKLCLFHNTISDKRSRA